MFGFFKKKQKSVLFVGKFWEKVEGSFTLKDFSVKAINESEALDLVRGIEGCFGVLYIKEKN